MQLKQKDWGQSSFDETVRFVVTFCCRIVEGKDSPTGNPLLLAAAENSNTVHVFEIEGNFILFFFFFFFFFRFCQG